MELGFKTRLDWLQASHCVSSDCSVQNPLHYTKLPRRLCRATGPLWTDTSPYVHLPFFTPCPSLSSCHNQPCSTPRMATFSQGTEILWGCCSLLSIYFPPFSTWQTPIHPWRSSSNIPPCESFSDHSLPTVSPRQLWPPARGFHYLFVLLPPLQACFQCLPVWHPLGHDSMFKNLL